MAYDSDFGFECDSCENLQEFGGNGFREDKAEIDSAGWKTKHIDGEWCHFCCEACYSQYMNDNGMWNPNRGKGVG